MPINYDAIDRVTWAYDLINVYIRIGEYDRAIEQIDYVLSIPSHLSLGRIKLDPLYDPIRNYPKFKEVLEKYEEIRG